MDRQTCTADRPYKDVATGRWAHPDAEFKETNDCWDGGKLVYQCPHCGLEFRVSVPDY